MKSSRIAIIALLLGGCGTASPSEPTPAVEQSASPLVVACEAGTTNSCLVAGNDAEQAGQDEEAARLYLLACTQGDARGCALAGGQFADDGNVKAANDAFAAGCALDDGTSCYGQGLVAVGTFGGESDYTTAAVAFGRGCELQVASACGDLAGLYLDGRGVDADPERADDLWNAACTAGDGASCTRLGLVAWRARDLDGARQKFEQACTAEMSDRNGCGYLGWFLWTEGGAEKERGILMLTESCQGGSAIACSLYANVHAKEGDVESGRARLAQACQLDPDQCESMTKVFEAALEE